MYKKAKMALAIAGVVGTVATAGAGTKLVVGVSSEPTSVDPYFHNLTPNNVASYNVFEELVYLTDAQGITPRLAVSWKNLPDNKVEVNLRKGVKFHDGTDFTANDVVYSVCRILNIKNSPSSLASQVAAWKDVEVVNDHKIIITKPSASPMMVTRMSSFGIMSDSVAGGGTVNFNGGACDGFNYVETTEFENGNAMIGTGPYKFKEHTKGEKIVYTKNENYWGNGNTSGNIPAAYDELELRPIKNAGARLAALLSGDVGVIEAPAVQDLPRLEKNPDVKVVVAPAVRTIYVMFNMKDDAPEIEGTNGKNPFQDRRVREALSLAIDRELLVKRIMGKLGQPATNIAPNTQHGMRGSNLKYRYDMDKAKALLAEAGYPNGFTVTLGAPNDRYINDAKVAQAVAQMWARVGVKTNVKAVTRSVFFGNRNKGVYPAWLAGWGSSTLDGESFVNALSGTVSKEKKRGASNKGGYSNAQIDLLLDQADAEGDPVARGKIIADAAAIVHREKNWFATHYQLFPWAISKSVDYNPVVGSERTTYRYFSPAK